MSLTGGGNTWQDFYFLTPGLSTSGHKSVVFNRCAFLCVIFCENIAKIILFLNVFGLARI
uniref:Uncharacterized protein n=1 Tax=Anguilla anguilla TaxID=7936 RepID=A0A0E9V1J1_ANGAN